MEKKKKNKNRADERKRRSVQELFALDTFGEYGLRTTRDETVFFRVEPVNITVLSQVNTEIKINSLMLVLMQIPNMEICCLDAAECFDNNKHYLQQRIVEESEPKIKALLMKDLAFLDSVQLEVSTARQFMFVAHFRDANAAHILQDINHIEKTIRDQGFEVQRMAKDEIKRMLAVYFRTLRAAEQIADYAGMEYLGDVETTSVRDVHRSKKRDKEFTAEEIESIQVKTFFDRVLPGAVKFFSDYYILGDSYRCVWAITEYAPSTQQQALLAQLADKQNVTLKIYTRLVDSAEQSKIITNATRRTRSQQTENKVEKSIQAVNDFNDVVELISLLQKERQPLLHCAVFIELRSDSLDGLKIMQRDIQLELLRSKITTEHLTLRQREGLLSVMPFGHNVFLTQYELALPASSVANLYPFSYSGKTDPAGFYLGRDKYGTNVIVDMDRRAADKTNSSALVIGNSGQGKSYLLKMLTINRRESGKSVLILDPEEEYGDLTTALGGCYLDFLSGQYRINPFEPKVWSLDEKTAAENSEETPAAFVQKNRLSQHIAFLKDFFSVYKNFSNAALDTLEIMLIKLYKSFDIDENTDFSSIATTDYPTAEDLYTLIEREYQSYDKHGDQIYTKEMLQELLLGITSMCRGSDSVYFNGHTNITDDKVICFGVKGLMDTNAQLKNAMLFNLLSYMNNKLLLEGNSTAVIDELYLFLEFKVAVLYIRNGIKRVRKRDSDFILATQNIEDANLPEIKEYTKPLFAIPTHQFIFNGGTVKPQDYMDMLQLEENEFELIRYPQRGSCLYKCGNERYLLQVHAPEFKVKLFGSAGGR